MSARPMTKSAAGLFGKLLRWMWMTERRFSSRYDDRRKLPVYVGTPFDKRLMRFMR